MWTKIVTFPKVSTTPRLVILSNSIIGFSKLFELKLVYRACMHRETNLCKFVKPAKLIPNLTQHHIEVNVNGDQ